MNESNPPDALPCIFSYTRAQALADGVLIDATETAREAGLRYPVALTQELHARHVEVPSGVEGQDRSGRLWDVLWMLRHAIQVSGPGKSEVRFTVLVRNDNRQARPVQLKALCGPGDDFEPVITVMLPHED